MERQNKFYSWSQKSKSYEVTDKVLSLSASTIKQARECQYKVYHKLTTMEKPPKSVPLVIGIVFHSCCEAYLKNRAQGKQNLTWQQILGVFEAEWAKGIVGVDFSKTTPEKAKMKALDYIKPYFEQALPLMYPTYQARFRPKDSIERFFNLKITYGGSDLKFSGKVDFIDRSLWCVDHKTAGSPWGQEDADNEVQAQLYPFCLKNLKVEIRGFKFMVVSKGKVTPFPVAYDEGKVANILREAFDLKRALEEGNLLRARSARSCSWCEWRDKCGQKIG